MMGWWEIERFAKVRVQGFLREAEQERLKRTVRDARARHPALLQRAATWLIRRALPSVHRRQEQDFSSAGLGQSSGPPVGLIL